MGLSVGAIQVTASASKIFSTVDYPNGSIVLYNKGPNSIYVGIDNTVSATTGFEVPSGATFTLDHGHTPGSDVWAICSVLQVSPADTRYVQEA